MIVKHYIVKKAFVTKYYEQHLEPIIRDFTPSINSILYFVWQLGILILMALVENPFSCYFECNFSMTVFFKHYKWNKKIFKAYLSYYYQRAVFFSGTILMLFLLNWLQWPIQIDEGNFAYKRENKLYTLYSLVCLFVC